VISSDELKKAREWEGIQRRREIGVQQGIREHLNSSVPI
jgi:hypothetical protein